MSRASLYPALIKMLRQMDVDDHLIFPYKLREDIPALRKCMTNTGRQLGHNFTSILSDKYLHIVRIH